MSQRRRFLKYSVISLFGFGVLSSFVPFVKSWNIRKGRIREFDVEVDLSRLKEGELIRTEWMGKPIHIHRRTAEDLKLLDKPSPDLRDPDSEESTQPMSAKNRYRSINPNIFVSVPLCTHLGCEAAPRFDAGAVDLGGDEWPGGYFCPCHGSKFDAAGRVFRGLPAPVNMEVPPHDYRDGKLIIGLGHEA
ncbi:ubiquinol-cytochrome c reductase iron-sulfur subunit [Microbulbifer echini]|uniref:Ubiquinol-cytochrome c reductase iron-sulfur subunit n=1 Tax=Microbulbifer echini TaxID=1529067 RepID=A0ABV4NTZ0_9GAMM